MKNYQQDFIREMKNRNYSRNTIRIYSMHIRDFLKFGSETEFEPDVRISVFIEEKKSSSEQKRLAWSAIKLFYRLILHKKCPYELDKIRSRKRLPDVLSNEEVLEILDCISNTKHKLMISMLYGSGLRVSEICSIKIQDLDFAYLKLKVRNSKGNKDRITLLSKKCVSGLKILVRDRKANEYIFQTQSNRKYSIRTVQKIFSDALQRSKLQKNSSCHTLRHCFATHLVESGVDIKTVKGLLGHQSIKTTMIYIKLADPMIRQIESPL